MHSYFHKALPHIFNKMFIQNRDIHSYTTRQADLYHVPVAKKDTLLRYFRFRAIQIFNNYVHILDYNNNKKLFKKILGIHLINSDVVL